MLKYAICQEQKLAVVEYNGELDYDTMVRYMNVIWNDPECRGEYSAICDYSRATLKMDSKDVERAFFYIMADERSLRGSCALVLTAPMATALGFIFKHLMQTEEAGQEVEGAVQVFYEWENACNFVNCLPDRNSFNWKTVD